MTTKLSRTLKPGGTFITQQVGGQDNIRLNELLQDEADYEFSYSVRQSVISGQ